MCSNVRNKKYEVFTVENDVGGSKEGETINTNLAKEKIVDLNDVLEVLVRLDEPGIFMDPVEDSFAPNYSKVIKTPMCFLTMKEKIRSHQYMSWGSFVEDFEQICYNAMKYNQKRSQIWNAANTLFHKGKKYLDQQMAKSELILGIYRTKEDSNMILVTDVNANIIEVPRTNNPQEVAHCNSLNNGHDVCERVEVGHGISVKEEPDLFPEKSLLSNVKINSILADAPVVNLKNCDSKEQQLSVFEGEALSNQKRLTMIDGHLNGVKDRGEERITLAGITSCVGAMDFKKGVPDDSAVEVVDLTTVDDIRLDAAGQATEGSSSFEGTQNEGSCPMHDLVDFSGEVQSLVRDGNGAITPADEHTVFPKKRKKPLSLEWKTFRRGIEWRCHWLELQIKELQTEAAEYEHIINDARTKKVEKYQILQQKCMDSSAARVVPLANSDWKHRVLLRRRRRKMEDDELSSYMSRHPLFSRYGKKQRCGEEFFVEDAEQVQWIDLADSTRQEKMDIEGVSEVDRFTSGQDSMEQLLWDIEALQMHVVKLKNQLNRGFPVHKKLPKFLSKELYHSSPRNSNHLSVYVCPNSLRGSNQFQSPTGQSGNRLLSGSKFQSSSVISRRRNSDYDINNVVMPGGAMATYVEPARHTFIETPLWRTVDDVASLGQTLKSSSEEDTDDEVYNMRHADMEVKERLQRYGPFPNKILSFGKGGSKCGVKGPNRPCGKSGRLIPPEDNSVHHMGFGFIPKRKRRKRETKKSSIKADELDCLFSVLEPCQGIPKVLEIGIYSADTDNLSDNPRKHCHI